MSDLSNVEQLHGRTAIITGASQGLGLEIARRYVAAGASVMICARDAELLSQAADELKSTIGKNQQIFSIDRKSVV